MFELVFTKASQAQLGRLEADRGAVGLVKQVKKTLGYLQGNPKPPSLQTHVFHSLEHPYDPKDKVFEAYVQHRTPSAYRIFWCYGPAKRQLTIVAITPPP
jgi:hypothetical protein